MRRFCAVLACFFVVIGAGASTFAQRPTPVAAPARLQLTVDSVMRGPGLVGWPPSNLRWSADSQRLYFSWRRPGEQAEALYVGSRDGGAPKRLSDEEAKAPPPATGRWDAARRRMLASEGGDVFIHDPAVPSARIMVTRTAGAESSPRWA